MPARCPWLLLPVLATLLFALGCPDDPTPEPPDQGRSGGAGGERGGPAGPGGPSGGSGDGGEGGTVGDGNGGEGPIVAVALEDREIVPYPLKQSAEWPGLPQRTPVETPPDPETADNLIAEARSLLAPAQIPDQPAASFFVNEEQLLFLQLKGGGMASLDQVQGLGTFAIYLTTAGQELSPGRVERLLAGVLHPDLMDELKTEGHTLRAHPRLGGPERFSATALLNPGGFGLQYPYLYVYARKGHLVIVLQHVASREGFPPPRDG